MQLNKLLSVIHSGSCNEMMCEDKGEVLQISFLIT